MRPDLAHAPLQRAQMRALIASRIERLQFAKDIPAVTNRVKRWGVPQRYQDLSVNQGLDLFFWVKTTLAVDGAEGVSRVNAAILKKHT